jgi:hypothetical protein
VHSQRTTFTQHVSHSEAHIHPLFRSDSPTPPPTATPGTIVFAAPHAGQVISDRQSIRSIQSMRRLRSESLPGVPSPLSRSESIESFFHRRQESGSTKPEIREEKEGEEGEGRETAPPVVVVEEPAGAAAAASDAATVGSAETARSDGERKMTPPIPDWILTAGMRLSLLAYNSRRKSRTSNCGGSDDEASTRGEPQALV